MAYTAPKVYYSATLSGTYTQLTGVQSIFLNRGRQRMQDPYNGNSVTIELIPATSYSPALEIGQYLDIKDSNSALSSETYFCGRITDIQRTYGIPYNSGTGAAPSDRYIITATGGVGQIGANTVTGIGWSTPIKAQAAAAYVALTAGVPATTSGSDTVSVSQQLVNNGSALEIINQLAITGQFGLADKNTYRGNYSATPDGIQFYNLNAGATAATLSFTDSSNSASQQYRYKEIEYLSGAQNAFTQVQISPEDLTPQSAQSGSAPYNTLAQKSYNLTESEALSLASFLLAISNETEPAPFRVTTDSTLDWVGGNAQQLVLMDYYFGVNSLAEIIFRGTTVRGFVQGYDAMFYPDRVTVTYYFSPSLGSPFILDSTFFGVLDTNRLGYP